VNGIVYAEEKGVHDAGYVLEAYIEAQNIRAVHDGFGNMELFVNDMLLAKKKRLL